MPKEHNESKQKNTAKKYKPKMQKNKQIHQQEIAQYGCAHTIQNAEMKQAENLHRLISHNTIKTVRNNTRKNPKANYF